MVNNPEDVDSDVDCHQNVQPGAPGMNCAIIVDLVGKLHNHHDGAKNELLVDLLPVEVRTLAERVNGAVKGDNGEMHHDAGYPLEGPYFVKVKEGQAHNQDSGSFYAGLHKFLNF